MDTMSRLVQQEEMFCSRVVVLELDNVIMLGVISISLISSYVRSARCEKLLQVR